MQAGFVGLVICGIWVLSSMFNTVHSPAQLRALQLALMAYLSLRGFLESGLFDASTAFLLFFAAVMATPLESSSPPDSSGTTDDMSSEDARLDTNEVRSG